MPAARRVSTLRKTKTEKSHRRKYEATRASPALLLVRSSLCLILRPPAPPSRALALCSALAGRVHSHFAPSPPKWKAALVPRQLPACRTKRGRARDRERRTERGRECFARTLAPPPVAFCENDRVDPLPGLARRPATRVCAYSTTIKRGLVQSMSAAGAACKMDCAKRTLDSNSIRIRRRF